MGRRNGKLTKAQRQAMIAQIIRKQRVSSQRDIVRALARAGAPVAQSTVSRDIEELGLVKVRDADGRQRYAMPGEGAPHRDAHLRTMVREFMLSVERSGNLAVVRTPPGTANALGGALDAADIPGVLGTVAGDDTILVVVAPRATASGIVRRLRTLGGST
jgi:transcriptional regulator of arginine metabolism